MSVIGAAMWLLLLPAAATQPAIVIMPQIIAAEVTFLFGLLVLVACVGFIGIAARLDDPVRSRRPKELPGGTSQWAIAAVAAEDAKRAARGAGGGRE